MMPTKVGFPAKVLTGSGYVSMRNACLYESHHSHPLRFESLESILNSVTLRMQMAGSCPHGTSLINASTDPYFTEMPPGSAEIDAITWGAYAFEDLEDPITNWAQQNPSDTASEEAALRQIGPDIVSCILEQGSVRQLF